MNWELITVFAIHPTDDEGRSQRILIEEVCAKKEEAQFLGEAKYGSHYYTIIEHDAVSLEDAEGQETIYLLHQSKPLKLVSGEEAREKIKKKTMAKLSAVEKQALGFV